MDIEQEIKELKEEEKRQERNPVYSCCSVGSNAWKFWGVALVVIGSIWLLGNLGLAATVLWPLLFIGLGLFYLSRARGDRYL